ncbi:MAG: MBL fold metallo-hydrolase [Nitrosomonadales bacterium]|nr:MBL fold metallo-hydrolase [Nitrosomonadales bacterium]
MQFASLGSGSEGNALVVRRGETVILMDCGFGLREATRRMARLGLRPEQLSGIVVTHEHGDHISGVDKLARRHDIPLWMTHGTRRAQGSSLAGITAISEIHPHESFSIGEIEVRPYPVPHDAVEPVQYVFSDGAKRLGVLTDVGHVTPHIEASLRGCDALVIECNHDAGMLAAGVYPPYLKRRVGGHYGHLNNQQAAALLGALGVEKLQHLVAAHLSSKNNTSELAAQALSSVLGCAPEWVAVASQSEGLDWREIR